MKFYPGILTDSFLELQQKVNQVKHSALLEVFHIDVIDGLFADNLTVTPLDLTVGDFEPAKLDFHLMVEEPMEYVYECEGVKDYLPIRRLIGQVERMSHQRDFLEEVRQNGWEAGLALDVFTPLEAIDDDIWADLDHILLMTVEVGHSAQVFQPQALEKVIEIRRHFPEANRLHILIDGGVKPSTLPAILKAGADEVTATSEVWESSDPVLKIEEFHRLATRS